MISESERLHTKRDASWLFCGDCRSMHELSDGIVQCVVTSPPYWGLRKYSGEQELIWGGDENCEHQWGDMIIRRDRGKSVDSDVVGQPREMIGLTTSQGQFCSLCGAWKGAYGGEPTPEMYIQHTIEILREIKRVLRKDGVVWWNIGDSYWVSQSHPILKSSDMCLIPQRLAIALQEDGWWVRSTPIWNKSNVMPESVNGWRWEKHKIKTGGKRKYSQPASIGVGDGRRDSPGGFQNASDPIWQDCPGCPKCKPNGGYVLRRGSWRPTEAHEFILMLTKSANYYCDKLSVIEPYTTPLNRWGGDILKADGESTWDEGTGQETYRNRNMRPNKSGRNLRSIWTFPTQSTKIKHFAAFPRDLPKICIKASTPEAGCCSECGAPWARIVERGKSLDGLKKVMGADSEGEYHGRDLKDYKGAQAHGDGTVKTRILEGVRETVTIGWLPTCKCNADEVPSIVLDPLVGIGTTLLVAEELGRLSVGYDISREYCDMAVKRLEEEKTPKRKRGSKKGKKELTPEEKQVIVARLRVGKERKRLERENKLWTMPEEEVIMLKPRRKDDKAKLG